VGQVLWQRVVRLKAKQVGAFDAALAKRGVPSVGELLVAIRMTLEAQNRSTALPKLTFNERLLMLSAIDRNLKGTLESAAENVAGYEKLPPPEKLQDFGHRLRIFRVTRQRLTAVRNWANYGTGLASKIVGRRMVRLKAADREIVEVSNAKRVQEISETEQQIEEVQMEIRLARLKFGVKVLKNPKLSKERFLAVYSTGLDAGILRKFLTPPPQPAAAKAAAEEEAAPQQPVG
jgi:hypothetical protein